MRRTTGSPSMAGEPRRGVGANIEDGFSDDTARICGVARSCGLGVAAREGGLVVGGKTIGYEVKECSAACKRKACPFGLQTPTSPTPGSSSLDSICHVPECVICRNTTRVTSPLKLGMALGQCTPWAAMKQDYVSASYINTAFTHRMRLYNVQTTPMPKRREP